MNFHQFQKAMLTAIDLAQHSDQIVAVSFDPTDHEDEDGGEDLEPTDDDDYNNAPVYPMPFFRPNKPDKSDEDQEPNHNDEDLEPTDDFGGSFPLSVEYDDDQPEPTYIDQDDDF
ncbi:MAG: hypothetical protein H7Y37_19805 [Anaerolineae bacterium]|nr:hypothetical protein [Gloeobacterales cyanobacterium ES-bin-313]